MIGHIVALILVVILIRKVIFSGSHTQLDALPGPPRWPLVGSLPIIVGLNERELFAMFTDFPRKYGHRVVMKVFNFYNIHLYNPKDIEIVLSNTKNITKDRSYAFLEPWLGKGLLLSTGADWHKRRKVLTPAFHFEILKGFAKVFEEESRNMVQGLRARLRRGENQLELMPFLSEFTPITICETAMAGCLKTKDMAKKEYKKSTLALASAIMDRLARFWLYPDILYSMSSYGKTFKKILEQSFSFTDAVIEERRKQRLADGETCSENSGSTGNSGTRRLALLDLLLEAESRGEIDAEGIREEVNTFMFAGHDTTSVALTFGLMLLADHEDVQEKIFEECKSIFGESSRTANTSDLAGMKYLGAVIKETLRLYPSAPFIGRKITEEFILDDIVIPRGSEVIVHIYDMHRRADLFPEPEAFKPERFLSGDRLHFSYVPFSAGPRNCIGQRYATQEMKYMLSEIVRHFKLYPIERGFRPVLKSDIVLRPDQPLYIKFAERYRECSISQSC